MKMKKNVKVIIILVITLMFFSTLTVNANSDSNWEDWRNENYWEWHTRTTEDDLAYNGRHIDINGNVINFYGYWQNSYKDFLYKEYNKQGKKIFQFRIDESKANYHTLDGAGFIFNANKVDGKLSGYVILFRKLDVCLYRLDNVDIEILKTSPNAILATYGTLIASNPKINSAIHDLRVEATPTKIKVTEGDAEIINLELDYSKHSGESFGLISSYVQHACTILSQIEFSELDIIVEDYKISILNTNMQGDAISGGYFEIKNEAGQIIKEGNTNANGVITVDGMIPGIYTVQQKSPPSTYILNDTIYEFEVTSEGKVVDVNSGEEIKLIVKNEQFKLEINNRVINTEDPIAGSKIGLYDNNGNEVMTAITDNNGIATFTGITEGNYTYKQIEVPDGFKLNTESHECTINSDGTIEFDNDDKDIIYNEKENKQDDEEKEENKQEQEQEQEEGKKDEQVKDNTVSNIIDNTTANTPIPKTGQNMKIISLLIIITIIFGLGTLIKIKQYKD